MPADDYITVSPVTPPPSPTWPPKLYHQPRVRACLQFLSLHPDQLPRLRMTRPLCEAVAEHYPELIPLLQDPRWRALAERYHQELL